MSMNFRVADPLINSQPFIIIIMLPRVSLEVCDEDFCSEPAIIVVAINGVNDNPPIISVMPAGQVSTCPYMSMVALTVYYFSHSLKATLWLLMLFPQLTFQMLTIIIL